MHKASAVLAIATILLAAASTTQAQNADAHKPRLQLIVSSGRMLPTGEQRDAVKQGSLTVAQLSYSVHPAVAITSSFGWTRTRDIASVSDPKLDVFTYDVGGEVSANGWLARGMFDLTPFAGVGAGGRTYNYRNLDIDATHNLAAYASAGGEIGIGSRVKLRLEARDYVTGFKPLDGNGDAVRRNDVSVMAGLRVKVR